MNTIKIALINTILILSGLSVYAQPQMSIWYTADQLPEPINSHHHQSAESAIEWTCGQDYYFYHESNQVILHVLNEGNEDLIISSEISSVTGEFSLNLLGLSSPINIAPNQELQIIVDFEPAESYSGQGATLSVNSNDPLNPSCQFSLEVGPTPAMPVLSCDVVLSTIPVSGFAGEDTPFNLSLAVPSDITEGFITICSAGDLGFFSEFYDVTILDTGEEIRFDGVSSDCVLSCQSFNVADISSIVEDGQIDFLLLPSNQVNDFCADNNVSISLNYCSPQCNGVIEPTAGGFARFDETFDLVLSSGLPANTFAATIEICSAGDLSSLSEFYDITVNNGEAFQFQGGTNDCREFCQSFVLNDIAGLTAAGQVSISLAATPDIGNFCPDNNVYATLSYCVQLEPVPTMGEWGLICLSILLLILGVNSIKQKSVKPIQLEIKN